MNDTGNHHRTPPQVAVITGTGSAEGIGFACAARLAAQGTRPVLTSTTSRIHDRVETLREQGAEAIGVRPACPACPPSHGPE